MKGKKKVVIVEVETNLNNDNLKSWVRSNLYMNANLHGGSYVLTNQIQVNLVKSPKK